LADKDRIPSDRRRLGDGDAGAGSTGYSIRPAEDNTLELK